MPDRLYTYMRRQFVDEVVERGVLLFRNLAYFRQIEDKGRADLLEGLHMDAPDNDVELKSVDGTASYKGPAAFLRSINQERFFVFCLSEIHDPALYREFGAERCVEIRDVPEFLRRCERRIARQRRFADSGMLHGGVEYYAPNRPVQGDITDPRQLPFFKHDAYSHQREFRLAAALSGGLKTLQRIVRPGFSFEDEVLAGRAAERKIVVGPLVDIVSVHPLSKGAA